MELTREFGTPLYVYNESILRQRCREMRGLIRYPKLLVNFSTKSNNNLALLKIIREEGLRVDAMSSGEIFLELEAGFQPDEILYVCNNASARDMQYALKKEVRISVDSLSQLETLGRICPGGDVAVRFNPGLGCGHHEKVVTAGKNTKFGVAVEDIHHVKRLVKQYNLNLVGLNQHIGSLFMQGDGYVQAAQTHNLYHTKAGLYLCAWTLNCFISLNKERSMDNEQDLRTSLKNNRREFFITETEELLAAWLFKKKSSTKRSKNMCAVPPELRCSRPNCDTSELMPCHVSIGNKAGQTITRITPAPEYSTSSCHGHGMLKKISLPDLESLNSMGRLEAITLTKKCFSPYVSPFFDTITLARVAKDLGIRGKAIPKVIKGRQYIAFSGPPGMRQIFTSTLYSARNAKIINMAIGAMGITKMATKGGIITIGLTVPLSVYECYLTDRSAWYELTGSVGADLLKVGIASLMGAILGIAFTGGSTFFVCPPIGAAIGISLVIGFILEYLDSKHKLTEKLIALLKEIPVEAGKAATAAGQGFWHVLRSGGLDMGGWGSIVR
jgi:hypothetical protein